MAERVYDVEDVLYVEYTLEPMRCRHCGGTDVTFHPHIGDGYCAECGKWQLADDEEKGENE